MDTARRRRRTCTGVWAVSAVAVSGCGSATPTPSHASAPAIVSTSAPSCSLPLEVYNRRDDDLDGFTLENPLGTPRLQLDRGLVEYQGHYTVGDSPHLTSASPHLSRPRAEKRWLPVEASSVAPDEKHFAYLERVGGIEGTAALHVVDVATGADTVLTTLSGRFKVADWREAGIYLLPLDIGIGTPLGGLTRIDASSGARNDIGPTDTKWTIVGDDAAWATTSVSGDPVAAGVQGGHTRLLRLDLVTRQVTTWYSSPGTTIAMDGLDLRELPIVEVHTADAFMVGVLDAPSQLRVRYSEKASTQPQGLLGRAVEDGHGLWLLSSTAGLVLVDNVGTVHRLSPRQKVPYFDLTLDVEEIAGPCT